MILKVRLGTKWTFFSHIKSVKFDVDKAHIVYLDGYGDVVVYEEAYLLNKDGQTIERIKVDMKKE